MLRKLVAHAAKAAQMVSNRIRNCTRRDRGVMEMHDALDKYEQNLCVFCLEMLNSNRNGCILVQCNHRFHFICLIQWAKECTTADKTFACPLCREYVQRAIDEGARKRITLKKLRKLAQALPNRQNLSDVPNAASRPDIRNGLEYRVPEENGMLLGSIPVLKSTEDDRRRMKEIEKSIGEDYVKQQITIIEFINETKDRTSSLPGSLRGGIWQVVERLSPSCDDCFVEDVDRPQHKLPSFFPF
ncbi:hypothetical protein PRIPAC_96922 [Pristionchus pacificus]|uniref:RING-type domain-containing protein n=1 Tax=Pristionchus pacificus TaxID=54126 RepID=A0A2A6CGZ5_PRIPA|nr:hypothetical protein PRIPAC_96922 [Pristionchus pacificus]|eukprot:PDM77367.1 hypothetical protein PRIPAC_33097 [Pristionchus pacificus]